MRAAGAGEGLEATFRNPPASARPLTWWHWLNGTITPEGITADLESMQRIGLGGCYLFNCGGRMPEGPVRFLQPEWLRRIDHTLAEARRLGLVFGVHNCDGFSQSGGPWITPAQSMKELVWSATDAEGPRPFEGTLAQPPAREGFYADIALVAFPIPAGGPLTGPGRQVRIRGTISTPQLARLADGDPATQARFPVRAGGHSVEFRFAEPRTVRSLTVRQCQPHRWEEDFPLTLEVAAPGGKFRRVGSFTANWDYQGATGATAAFDDVAGATFRVTFDNPWPFSVGELELSDAARVHFAEAKAGRLRSRGHGAERRHHDAHPGPARGRKLESGLIVTRGEVRDLTDRMTSDGRVTWDVPAGRWRLLRVGYTSNGHYVSPATAEGRGLECDKLDPQTVRFHLEQYVGKLLGRGAAAPGRTFVAMEIDSWECGIQNWTAGLERRFRERIGYDLCAQFPLLLEGWIVDDADASERVLWDWRRFLADQFSECYFAESARFARERGLVYVGESNGRQQYLYDVAYSRNSAVTMGEFWLDSGPGQGVRVDNKVASSIAHTTGKPIVASESYTASPQAARWQNHPFSLKAEGDRAYCAGVNQFVFHTFAHQPYPATGPGFTFFFWGLNFNRANTWWEPGRAWMTYLTRCNAMLREGRPVADVLFLVGEDVPNRIGWRDELRPPLPAGHDFDGCDVGALMKATVRDGRIRLASGTEYRVLLLPDLPTMRPATLAQVRALVASGATVLGRKPTQSPSLRDLGEGDATVRRLADELWGEGDARTVARRVGSGLVFAGITFEDLFRQIGLTPDFDPGAARPGAEILYAHRQTDRADLYFVSNQGAATERLDARFRTGARAPELWDPATGEICRPAVFRVEGDRVRVPLRLDPAGSVFVVFRQPAPERHAVATPEPIGPNTQQESGDEPPACELELDARGAVFARACETFEHRVKWNDGTASVIRASAPPPPVMVPGPWRVRFPAGSGAPDEARFDRLISWPERTEPGIRFFSGTATYDTEFTVAHDLIAPGREWQLDLGAVAVIAEATLNGRALGILWKPPFRVPTRDALQPGTNRLEIRVTNLWPNRMIGDAPLPDDMEWQRAGKGAWLPSSWPDWLVQGRPRPSGRIAFCTRKNVYAKDDPLLPSGLLGPVRLKPATRVPAGQ